MHRLRRTPLERLPPAEGRRLQVGWDLVEIPTLAPQLAKRAGELGTCRTADRLRWTRITTKAIDYTASKELGKMLS